MKLDDFVLLSIKQLLAFREHWIALHRDDPELTPIELPDACEWRDQLLYWEDVKDD